MPQEKNRPTIIDVTGRVLSLEQRVKGLQGRLSAIEVRLSGTEGNNLLPDTGAYGDTEFFPAADLSGLRPEPDTIDVRLSALEQMLTPDGNNIRQQHMASNIMDTTGIIAGFILVGAGLLLYTGNIDIIKNPLLSLGCGIILILFSFMRSISSKTITKSNE